MDENNTTVTTDAGAVTSESTPAAVTSETTVTPETTGASAVNSESQSAAIEGETEQVEGSTSQEGSTTQTEGHNKTLEQRVQELAEKRISEVETRLTAKLEAVTQAKAEEKPDFFEIDLEKVNDHIRTTMDQIEDLKLEGNYLKAMELQDGLSELRQGLRANEQKKAEWTQKVQSQQQNEQAVTQTNEAIAKASELIAKEHNVSPEVWKAAEDFFNKERSEKPLIDAQYREKVYTQGPIAALLWAKEYVEKNMGKKEQEAIDKKELAKTTLPPGKTSTGEATGNADLAALRAQATKTGNAEDLAKYTAAKAATT